MFADRHVAEALHDGWGTVAASYDTFLSLFETTEIERPIKTDPSIIREWYDQLAPGGDSGVVKVIYDSVEGRTPPPMLAVSMSDAIGDPTEFLGAGGDPELVQSEGVVWRQRVSVTALARSTELAQALVIIAGSIVTTRYNWFLGALGYSGVSLAGIGRLQPEVKLMPERVNVYRQYIAWNFVHHMRFSRINEVASQAVKVSVHHFDAVDAYGNPGQVRTEET